VIENFLQQLAIWAVPVVAAVVLHEVAHGVVAYRLGDPTAARMGRLTLNPFKHMDLFGTVLLPIFLLVMHSPFLFGYAKPVPVDYRNLRNPKRDMIWVAMAGPITNLALASMAALIFRTALGLPYPAAGLSGWLAVMVVPPVMLMLHNSVLINVVLAVFNLLPIPPLDGGRVLAGLLPLRQAVAFARLEPFGMVIVMTLLATDVLGQVVGPVVDIFLRVLL